MSKRKKSGIELIVEERAKQLTRFSVKHDVDVNNNKELAFMATALIESEDQLIPDNWNVEYAVSLIDKKYKDRLIIAGAFIAAELDRIMISKNKIKDQ